MSRLIDADALKLAVIEEGQRSRRYKIGQTWELNRDEIWKVIDSMPTIEESKTGHWVEDGYHDGEIVCSECGEPCSGFIMAEPRDKFCKWCGCKMMEG